MASPGKEDEGREPAMITDAVQASPPELFTRGPAQFLAQALERNGVEVDAWGREIIARLARLMPAEVCGVIAGWVNEAGARQHPEVQLRIPCAADGCPHVAGLGHFLCSPCWDLVPLADRRKVIRAYRAGSPSFVALAVAATVAVPRRREAS
jgi:hypothetical protein